MIRWRQPSRRTGARLTKAIGALAVFGALWGARGALISATAVLMPLGLTLPSAQISPAPVPATCTGGAMP